MGRLPVLRDEHFQAVNTTNEEEILRRFGGYVRSLHGWLNGLPCVGDRRWPACSRSFVVFALSHTKNGTPDSGLNLLAHPPAIARSDGFPFGSRRRHRSVHAEDVDELGRSGGVPRCVEKDRSTLRHPPDKYRPSATVQPGGHRRLPRRTAGDACDLDAIGTPAADQRPIAAGKGAAIRTPERRQK